MIGAYAIFVLALVCGAQAAAVFDPFLDTHWENFKRVYGKHYSSRDEGARRIIWENNVAEIVRHNLEYDLGMHTYKKGQNEYVDMSHEEFVKTLNGYRRPKLNTSSSTFISPSNLALPSTVDWRKQGYVTGVKNQGMCGACWAFSATGSLEGQHKKKTGKLVPLSVQNLVDCVRPGGSSGCEGGGSVDQAFEYVKENGGIDTEKSYPFTGEYETCHFKKSGIGATCTGYVDLPSGDESALQKAVATIGPISVAIDASQLSFQLYSAGVYDDSNCSPELLDHAVLIVGYGTEDGKDYWLVKNSWGTSWGEDGYIKMSRNKNNQCGIATAASYPLE